MEATIEQAKANWDCVITSAKAAFSATCGVELQEQQCEDLASDGVILAVISLVGDVEWSLFLGLPRTTACQLAGKFAGFEIPFDSDDMGDAIGELANILAGQLKASLDTRGIKAEISLPSVMRAEGMHVLIQRGAASQKLCFGSPLGKFWTGVIFGRQPGMVA